MEILCFIKMNRFGFLKDNKFIFKQRRSFSPSEYTRVVVKSWYEFMVLMVSILSYEDYTIYC